MARRFDAATFLDRLRKGIGADSVSVQDDPRTHAHVSGRPIGTPLAWARPTTTELVAETVRLADAHGIVVVPVGAATTFWDGLRVEDALVLDARALRDPFVMDVDARLVHVGAGVSVREVDRAARREGLVLAARPDAAGDTPIGSLLAVGSTSGVGMGHGLAVEQVTGATVVLGSGAVVRLGASHMLHGRADCAHGLPSALGLLASAEGRGGVITEVGLLLRKAPYIAIARASRPLTALPALGELEAMLAVAREGLDARWVDTFRIEVGFDGDAPRGRLEVMVRVFSDIGTEAAQEIARHVGERLAALGFDGGTLESESVGARRGEGPDYELHWSFPEHEHRARLAGGGFWGLETTVAWGAALTTTLTRIMQVFESLSAVAPRHRRFAVYPGHHIVSVGVQTLVPVEGTAIEHAIAILESAHEDVLRVGVPYRRGRLWQRAMAHALEVPIHGASQHLIESLFATLDPRATIGSHAVCARNES